MKALVHKALNMGRLLLPALIPSWRFFDTIAPSPRIEVAALGSANETPEWNEFRPSADKQRRRDVLKRLFWNPHWNEKLYLVSCAERLSQDDCQHALDEIKKRIRADLKNHPLFQFRLVFIHRAEEALEKNITYLSPIYTVSGDNVP